MLQLYYKLLKKSMKKIFFLLSLSFTILLAGCGNEKKISGNSPASEIDNWQPDQGLICSHLCGRKIPEMCENEIEELTTNEIDPNGLILDDASCQLMCEADWSEATIACVSEADECAQLSSNDPYCIDDTQDPSEADINDPLPGNCVKACENYTHCAAYGDDVTLQDLDDAFVSCLEFCSTLDGQSRNCLASTIIRKPNDCAAQTACILPDVRELLDR
jgi:hypothetical protein